MQIREDPKERVLGETQVLWASSAEQGYWLLDTRVSTHVLEKVKGELIYLRLMLLQGSELILCVQCTRLWEHAKSGQYLITVNKHIRKGSTLQEQEKNIRVPPIGPWYLCCYFGENRLLQCSSREKMYTIFGKRNIWEKEEQTDEVWETKSCYSKTSAASWFSLGSFIEMSIPWINKSLRNKSAFLNWIPMKPASIAASTFLILVQTSFIHRSLHIARNTHTHKTLSQAQPFTNWDTAKWAKRST